MEHKYMNVYVNTVFAIPACDRARLVRAGSAARAVYEVARIVRATGMVITVQGGHSRIQGVSPIIYMLLVF